MRCSWVRRLDQNSRRQILERLRFANTGEWIAHHRLDQLERAQCNLAIGLNPVDQILTKLRLKNCIPHDTFSTHATAITGVETNILAQSGNRLRRTTALLSALERGQQTLRVRW